MTANGIATYVLTNINIGDAFFTPDARRGAGFTITNIDGDGNGFSITTIGGTTLSITREAIVATIDYLRNERATLNTSIEIGSSNSWDSAGPLCRAARIGRGNPRVINYLLPVLNRPGICGGSNF